MVVVERQRCGVMRTPRHHQEEVNRVLRTPRIYPNVNPSGRQSGAVVQDTEISGGSFSAQ